MPDSVTLVAFPTPFPRTRFAKGNTWDAKISTSSLAVKKKQLLTSGPFKATPAPGQMCSGVVCWQRQSTSVNVLGPVVICRFDLIICLELQYIQA